MLSLRPEIIHYVDGVGWMIIAGIGLKSKRIAHQHFRPDVGPDGHKRFRSIRWLSGSADRVIAISAGAGRQLVEKCGIPQTKVVVVHNAVDQAYLVTSQTSVNVSCQTSSGERILGMAVRIVADKGIEDALHLLQILPSKYVLVIAGDGPCKLAFEDLAIELGVASRTRWLGSVRNISEFYASIDFYLFMSWYEGFGLSVAEAMFSRKPVVGLLGDGEIAELEYPLVHKANSLLVDRSTIFSFESESNPAVIRLLADSILHLDADEKSRDAIVESAYSWVSQRFSANIQAQRTLNVYRSTLGENTS